MPDRSSYYTQMNRSRTEKLRAMAKELPVACSDFFRAIEPTTSVLTRVNYAYDLRLFFQYLHTESDRRFTEPVKEWADDTLAKLTVLDIEKYIEYLSYFKDEKGRIHENGNTGKARKVSSLKSFYKYLYRSERVSENVLEKVVMPKIHEKEIIRLEADEVANLLDTVESGAHLTRVQGLFHDKTQKRDVALLTLLLGTGIRISELVGLDLNNVDFSTNSFLVTRKGGARVVLYFGEEVKGALYEAAHHTTRHTEPRVQICRHRNAFKAYFPA
jgi:integrase/recombinase XerC